MTCAGCGACRSMVCLSLSLSATREPKADFSVVWTAEKKEPGRGTVGQLSWKLSYHIDKKKHVFLSNVKASSEQTSRRHSRHSLLLASLQKSSWRRDPSVGESGDSGQISGAFASVVERLGFEAWRRGDWEEMQLGTWWTKSEKRWIDANHNLSTLLNVGLEKRFLKIWRCTCSVALGSLPLFLDRHLLGLFSFLGMS